MALSDRRLGRLPSRVALLAGGALLGSMALHGCGSEVAAEETTLPPFTVLGRLDRNGPLRIELDASKAPLPAERVREALEAALATWIEAGARPFEAFTVQPTSAAPAPDLVLRWDDGSLPDSPLGRDTSVATTRRPGAVGGEPGELLLDARRAWTAAGEFATGDGAVDLVATLVHELGHVLGLGHVEDPTSVMHPQREFAARAPGPGDRAGVRALYGGGEPGRASLVVRSPESRPLVLDRVAPPDSDWTLFDTDADGRDELLIWALGPGDGALTVYRFERGEHGTRLARTDGPFLGLAGHGASVRTRVDVEGARWLEAHWPDGSFARHRFDERGVPRPVLGGPAPEDPELEEPIAGPVERRGEQRGGDLDGDGRPEQVEPGAHALLWR